MCLRSWSPTRRPLRPCCCPRRPKWSDAALAVAIPSLLVLLALIARQLPVPVAVNVEASRPAVEEDDATPTVLPLEVPAYVVMAVSFVLRGGVSREGSYQMREIREQGSCGMSGMVVTVRSVLEEGRHRHGQPRRWPEHGCTLVATGLGVKAVAPTLSSEANSRFGRADWQGSHGLAKCQCVEVRTDLAGDEVASVGSIGQAQAVSLRFGSRPFAEPTSGPESGPIRAPLQSVPRAPTARPNCRRDRPPLGRRHAPGRSP